MVDPKADNDNGAGEASAGQGRSCWGREQSQSQSKINDFFESKEGQ